MNKLKSIIRSSQGNFKPCFNMAYITPKNENDQSFEIVLISSRNIVNSLKDFSNNQQKKNIIFLMSISNDDTVVLKKYFNEVFSIRKTKLEHTLINYLHIDNLLENVIINSGIEDYILHSYCSDEDYILFKLIYDNYTENIDKNDPLPFGAIFYNSKTFEIYHSTSNEYTKIDKTNKRHELHAETLGSRFMSNYKYDYSNLYCLTTYSPCPKCFDEMNLIADKNSSRRLHKFIYLLNYYENKNPPYYNMRKNNNTRMHFDPLNKISSDFVSELIQKSSKYINVCKKLIYESNKKWFKFF